MAKTPVIQYFPLKSRGNTIGSIFGREVKSKAKEVSDGDCNSVQTLTPPQAFAVCNAESAGAR